MDQRAGRGFVGRERERAVLAELTEPGGPMLLVHLYGIAGVGKSALLQVALAEARSRGATVVRLDCRAIEPTERGFVHELGAAIGGASDRVEDVAGRLGSLGSVVVLALDNYEVFRLMGAWLRQVFVPALDANARVIVAGREPPLPAWFASAEWQGLFRSVPLGPLEERDALELLARCEVSDEAADEINRIARGHPLALKLAASALTERPDLGLEEAAMQRVVEELTRLFLADVRDPLTRQALDAASVVRRATQPLLQAMLPKAAPQDALSDCTRCRSSRPAATVWSCTMRCGRRAPRPCGRRTPLATGRTVKPPGGSYARRCPPRARPSCGATPLTRCI